MFPSVDKLFIKYDISWDFITGLGIDNTNANIGEHNSVKSRAIEKNHNIYCWMTMSYSSQCCV